MKLNFRHAHGKTNHHGTQKPGEPWDQATVRGWKLKLLDLKKENSWQEGFGARCYFYWRAILYLPSGACHYFDLSLSRKEKAV